MAGEKKRLAQDGRCGFVSSEGLVLLARRALFLSYVHFVWQEWDVGDILKSGTSFCMAGAGNWTLSHPCACVALSARC